jgi:hypothetical protein
MIDYLAGQGFWDETDLEDGVPEGVREDGFLAMRDK